MRMTEGVQLLQKDVRYPRLFHQLAVSRLVDGFVFTHKAARQRPASFKWPVVTMDEQHLQVALAQGKDDQVDGDGRMVKPTRVVSCGIGGKLFRLHLGFNFCQAAHGNLRVLHASPFINRPTKPFPAFERSGFPLLTGVAKGNAW